MSRYNKPKHTNQSSKNPLEVDLGFFGKVNTNKVPADKFFVHAENNQGGFEDVEPLRQIYNDILENRNIPQIEEKVVRFLGKIQGAESAGRLKQLMRNLTAEGLVEAQNGRDGRPYNYKRHPQIQRTDDLVKAWKVRKRQLSDKYQEIINKPNGIRVRGETKLPRAHRPVSFSLVCLLDFGKNKSGHDTVTITDLLPVHGPNIGTAKTTYVIGYSAPDWLTPAISQVKNKLKRLAEEEIKKAAEAEKAKTIAPADTATAQGDAVETDCSSSQAAELTIVPEAKAPAKPKTKKAPPKSKKKAAA